MFLYPLMLQAYRGLPFQPWIRGAINGIEPEEMARLLGLSGTFRRGVASHVLLHARLQKKRSLRQQDIRQSMREAGFSKSLIVSNVAGLRKIVERLDWSPRASMWSRYSNQHSYSPGEYQKKIDFVRRATAQRQWQLVWDLGGNDGTFSGVAAEHSDTVVLMDSDALTIEHAYRQLRENQSQRILPLCVDLSDPSPARGWRGAERKSLEQRGLPDLVIALALVHHLVIGANIRLSEFIDWLVDLNAAVLVEFVTREDELVRELLRNREDQFSDYDLDRFEALVQTRFSVIERMSLKGGQRMIYFLARLPQLGRRFG